MWRNQSAYDLSNGELVGKLMEACFREGPSRCGFAIDVSGGGDYSDSYYLSGIVLSRMAGATRPFKEGDKVKSKSPEIKAVYEGRECYTHPTRLVSGELTVRTVFYTTNGWDISFKEKRPELCFPSDDGERCDPCGFRCRFRAEDFELVQVEAGSTSA